LKKEFENKLKSENAAMVDHTKCYHLKLYDVGIQEPTKQRTQSHQRNGKE